MKILSLFAAALVAVTGVAAAAPAAAQERVVVHERTVTATPRTQTRVVVRQRTRVRRDYGYRRDRAYGYRHRRGHAYAYGRRAQRVCTVRFRGGERIRTCRTRRY